MTPISLLKRTGKNILYENYAHIEKSNIRWMYMRLEKLTLVTFCPMYYKVLYLKTNAIQKWFK